MSNDELQILVKRYLEDTATEIEKQQLMEWYRQRNEKSISWHRDRPDEAAEVKERLLSGLQTYVRQQPRDVRGKGRLVYQWIPYAAAIFLLASGLMIGLSMWTNTEQKVSAPLEHGENRYLTLPDGSTALLRHGSQLYYPEVFKGDYREVTLIGEAFFDVAEDRKKPFIIHTGKVKTTVLGTAFNIRAFPDHDEVTVSVSRGKVQVEDELNVLVVLTQDQQVVYRPTQQASVQSKVKTAAVTEWIRKDMSFDAVPFKELAERLERRYDVEIAFKNSAMEDCPISGRFSGVEPLDQVLTILCGTRNASYTMHNGYIQIDGEGCR